MRFFLILTSKVRFHLATGTWHVSEMQHWLKLARPTGAIVFFCFFFWREDIVQWRSLGKGHTLCVTDSPSDLEEAKEAAVKSKLPASPGRKIVKKVPAKTGRCVCVYLCIFWRSSQHTALEKMKRPRHFFSIEILM